MAGARLVRVKSTRPGQRSVRECEVQVKPVGQVLDLLVDRGGRATWIQYLRAAGTVGRIEDLTVRFPGELDGN
jgi:hypothetical protein